MSTDRIRASGGDDAGVERHEDVPGRPRSVQGGRDQQLPVRRVRPRPTRGPVFALLALAASAFAPLSGQPADDGTAGIVAADGSRIHGVSLVAPRVSPSPDLMGDVREMGAGWVAVAPCAFLRPGSGELVFEHPNQFPGERSEGIREQVELAWKHGLRVLLKPHVWARAYEAFFRAWWDEPWLAGAFLWKWFLEARGRGWGGERAWDTGFTPQGKPAEAVIRRWYGQR